MSAGPFRFADLRHAAFLTLAAIAVALKVLVPPGFVLAADTGDDLPIVMCTAYGAKVVHTTPDPAQAPADDGADHDAPCAFTGHAAAPTPPLPVLIAQPSAASTPVSVSFRTAATPGRGLAAPPPPSHAPPLNV